MLFKIHRDDEGIRTMDLRPQEETAAKSVKSASGLQALISKFQTKEEALKSNESWVKPVDLDLYCNQEQQLSSRLFEPPFFPALYALW